MATVCGLPQPQLRTEACTRWLGAVAGFRGTVGGRAGGFPFGKHQPGLAQSIALWAVGRRQAAQSLCRGRAVCHLLSRVRRLKEGGSGDCTRPEAGPRPHPEVPGWRGGARAGGSHCVSLGCLSRSLEKEVSALWCPAPQPPSAWPPTVTWSSLPSPSRLQPCPTLSSHPHLILCFLLLIVSSRLQIILIIWGPNHVH